MYKSKIEVSEVESVKLCIKSLYEMGQLWIISCKLKITGTSAYILFT